MQNSSGGSPSGLREEREPAQTSAKTASPKPAGTPKLRSCIVCRTRRVRCDKQSPCSNCRRANIACVLPPTDRPPRWARRLERAPASNSAVSKLITPQDATSDIGRVMDRVHNLENLVKELRGQLEEARAATNSSAVFGSTGTNSSGTPIGHPDVLHEADTPYAMNGSDIQKQFGRLVLQDHSSSHYVSSGFWSRVNDELDGLKVDIRSFVAEDFDSSDDEADTEVSPSTHNSERTPLERNEFLFRHNLTPSTQSALDFHPLPSQIPFLIDLFSENVNFVMQIVHIPTINKTVRNLRGGQKMNLSPAFEALLFSMYYAAICSLEEDDVRINFGESKYDISSKYRLGFERALAAADFLDSPDIVLVQALAIFLCVVRRDESPRFVWMMTGLAIRMAQYLGLQRDGSHFEHLKPFEIEIRRRIWWNLCALDLRTSEDQGTDLTIARDSFDTKIPLNINDADLSPDSDILPPEHNGITDMSFTRVMSGLCEVMRQMMFRLGSRDGAADLEHQSQLLNEMYGTYERGYLQYTTESNICYRFLVAVARITMAKMTLIAFLPVLFSSPSEGFSHELRNKLLVSAIEVAEYNHALNTEQEYRHWHWICQTYTHWHAIVYIMIEISRRPWTAMAERAWAALHSPWLIPAKTSKDRDTKTWVPLHKLMAKCHRHRAAELERLQADPQEAQRLDIEDQTIPMPSSPELSQSETGGGVFRATWRKLVAPVTPETRRPTSSRMIEQDTNQTFQSPDTRDERPVIMTDDQPVASSAWSDGYTAGPGSVPWLWNDADPSIGTFPQLELDHNNTSLHMDFGDMDWYSWIESAKEM